MALDDKDIFAAICSRFADQPIEFIMEQYAKAKRMNQTIERHMDNCACGVMGDGDIDRRIESAMGASAPGSDVAVMETVEITPEPAPKKRYTKRQLKVKPSEAITEDVIFCCICGEPRQNLTARHLATHGISVEDYKKVCGYAPNQPLMSLKRLAKSKEIIKRAQQARMDKKAERDD